MKVHLFGATSSPSCAAFSLRQAARDFGGAYEPVVASTVERCMYVDDCLTSVSDVETAIELVDGLRSLLAKAGFRLTKWLSNSEEVLASIPENELTKSLHVHALDCTLQERILGVAWNVQSDTFRFSVALPLRPRTRRGLLSTVNSLFDPLGFVAPVVLEVRLIYRNLCQMELEWDEPMPEQALRRWERWLSSLPDLRSISIPRSFHLNSYENMQKCQIHCFADASTLAYGAVCYIRAVDHDSEVVCTLCMAKSRLVPAEETSIPRLELMAAVMAVELERSVQKELNLDLRPSVFWTDSKVVLQSIRNDRKRFPSFVARRLALIENNTCISNWRHVPTKQNPADLVSRGTTPAALVRSEIWLTGPEFLKDDPRNWPDPSVACSDVDPTVFEKSSNAFAFAVVDEEDCIEQLIARFSCLRKLKVAVAWLR